MKEFALILVLLLVWSCSKAFGTGTEPQDSNAGKSPAAASKKTEEQKKPGKEAGAQQPGKKKANTKDKEDCGCETTLFGEPVPQIPKPTQGKTSSKAGKQTTKSNGKNIDRSKTAAKSDLKEAAVQNSEK
jgi:hypothetical protein